MLFIVVPYEGLHHIIVSTEFNRAPCNQSSEALGSNQRNVMANHIHMQ